MDLVNKILGSGEGYTKEYLEGDFIRQYELVEKVTKNLSEVEKEHLYELCTCYHIEFMRMVGYIAKEDQ